MTNMKFENIQQTQRTHHGLPDSVSGLPATLAVKVKSKTNFHEWIPALDPTLIPASCAQPATKHILHARPPHLKYRGFQPLLDERGRNPLTQQKLSHFQIGLR